MAIEIRAFAGAASAATGEPGTGTSTRALQDGFSSVAAADGDPLPGSADACFAALVAWLMQVQPAASHGETSEGVSGDHATQGAPTIARVPLGGTTPSPFVANGAVDARDLPTDRGMLARAALSMAAAPSGVTSDATEPAAALPAHPSESAPRSAAPLDLSFLNTASAGMPARELPAASGGTGAEPRMQFASELGQRVVTMVEHGAHDARLRVHPEHLGPIEIRVRLDGDSAQVTFHSAHAAVRDALADAVPRLRELLGAAGFGLGHVDIGAGDPQWAGTSDGRADDTRAADPNARESSTGAPVERDEPERVVAVTRGLVDTFA